MATSSNITLRPRFKALTRLSDDAVVFVNLDMVRFMETIPNGVRLHFDSQPGDRLEVKLSSIKQLREQLTP